MGWLISATERLQRRLFPFMGPAQVQPVEGQTVRTVDAACPLCGLPLAAHAFDRSPSRATRMECPPG
jgi:hypothetical protein